MYFKRLEAHGFKSFANKTTLEFGPGVTCIVGPNGTGKTNVADSIRWVLGEHASRTLRARKTEDVIFAGSDKRAAMGYAEVSIALDNAAHWLPVDFDEVTVTRRAYRSGENEYLINSARVRLRDVIELFMRAQVGQNSYAFMGQGMVEQALSLRPEDRRALIEEAADVRIYRNKLEDARHKLKATRENVERVRMLVREIEPRITQLERQANRASRYRELTQELAATLHAWYAHQWREVNDQLLAAEMSREQRAEELERTRAEAKACEDGLAQLQAAIRERRDEIRLREGRLRTIEDYARDLDRRAGLDDERARMLEERTGELRAELAALRDEQTALERQAPLPDTSEREQRLAEAKQALAATRERLESVEREIIELERTAAAAEQAAAQARASAEELAGSAQAATERAEGERTAAAQGQQARQRVLGEVAAWARDFARERADVASVRAELERAEHDRTRTLAALDEPRRQRAELDAELTRSRAEASAARVRMELLETIEVQPSSPDAGVRAILEAGGLLRREAVPPDVVLEGVVGLVGQLVRVPPGLEKAIEAALAENLFAVVFERRTQLRAAVDMLLGGDAGRATMYALDSFQELRPIHLIKEKGVVGVASGLVRCDSRYRRLIDTLLGRTVVVENADVAQRFVRRGLAQAVATLDGVLLRPVGSIAAGSVATVRATFAQRREVGEIPDLLEDLEAAIAERAAKVAALDEQMAPMDDRRRQSEEATAAARGRISALEARRSSSRSALAGHRARLLTLRAGITRHEEEARRWQAAAQRASEERDARTRAALAAEEARESARRSLADVRASREQLVAATAEQAAIVAQFDGGLRAEYEVTGAERASRERLARQIAAKEEQASRFGEEARTIALRLQSTRRELAEKSDEIASLSSELEPARRELAQFESRERSLSGESFEANGRLRETERALTDAVRELELRREELESLRVGLESEGFVATADGEVRRAPSPEEVAAQDGGLPGWMRSEDGRELPPIMGGTTINPTEVRDRIAELRGHIRALGPVNETAATDFVESRERYQFLTTQMKDLEQAETQLLEAIDELEGVIRERFRTTFRTVNAEFQRYFSAFFRGGTARLELGETDDDGLPGVDIIAQPPGKKLGSLALLSGGERSLTAVALLFALLAANPSPICVLDEVDAALDEANVGRFVEELRKLAERTQFIIITHNRRTIEIADTIYGVSMGADSVSRVLSLKLSDIPHRDE